jgi:predicted AAA+ superfamily ATPase
LESVTQYLFDNIGSLFTPNSVSKHLKSQRIQNTLPTVQNQVRGLADTFIVHRVRQYDLKGKRYLEINDKYFVGDLGLRHAVLGYRESDIGGMLENVVCLELLRHGWRVAVGRSGAREVDFVAEKEEERIYLQVAYLMPSPETVDREFSVLESIRDNHPKYVLSMDPLSIKRESGVKHLRILDFLLGGFPSNG